MTRAMVVLVRHPEVARAWRGRCYGRSDMSWSREGARRAAVLIDELVALRPTAIVHSDLVRTRRLAERFKLPTIADPRWRERDFGSWEGRSWDAIWRETGSSMDRMVTDPEHFRPGGGETTREVADRARVAWDDLPADGIVVVVTHGGPIALVRAVAEGISLDRAVGLVPACGEQIRLGRRALG